MWGKVVNGSVVWGVPPQIVDVSEIDLEKWLEDETN